MFIWRRGCRTCIDAILISRTTFLGAHHLYFIQCLDSCYRNVSFRKKASFSPFFISFFFFLLNHVIVILLLSGVFLQTFSHFQNQFSTTSITPLTAKSPFWDNDDHYLLTTYLFICSPRIAQPVPLMWNLPIWQDGVEIITMGTFLIRILWAPIFPTVFLTVKDFFFSLLPRPFRSGCIHNLTWGNTVIYAFMRNAFWEGLQAASAIHLHQRRNKGEQKGDGGYWQFYLWQPVNK